MTLNATVGPLYLDFPNLHIKDTISGSKLYFAMQCHFSITREGNICNPLKELHMRFRYNSLYLIFAASRFRILGRIQTSRPLHGTLSQSATSSTLAGCRRWNSCWYIFRTGTKEKIVRMDSSSYTYETLIRTYCILGGKDALESSSRQIQEQINDLQSVSLSV